MDYDPYGNLTSSSGTTYNPYRYAGGYQDIQTGLYHFGQRYDDPSSGTWTQRDPLAGVLNNPTTMNRYIYGGGSPVNVIDSTGTTYTNVSFSGLLGIGATVGFSVGDGGFHPFVGVGTGAEFGGSVTVHSGEAAPGIEFSADACYGGCIGGSYSATYNDFGGYAGFGTDIGASADVSIAF